METFFKDENFLNHILQYFLVCKEFYYEALMFSIQWVLKCLTEGNDKTKINRCSQFMVDAFVIRFNGDLALLP